MDIAITGSTGLIGTALVARLEQEGHRAVRVVRGNVPPAQDVVHWDPAADTIDAAGLEGLDAVVHLAGAGIGDKRWTEDRKRLIRESRVRGTTLVAQTLARLDRPPRVFVSASGIDYYGDTGDDPKSEDASRGEGFLAHLVEEWESATRPAADAGIRTVCTRSGMVLSRQGGALPRMLLPFRLGLGGRQGSGRQYMSWIAVDDEVGAILHAITTDAVVGPANLVAPNSVTNRNFTKTLGRVLRRPTFLPTPMVTLKAVYGSELVEHLLLESKRAVPAKLTATGYEFRHPELEGALRAVLGKPPN